MTTSKNHSYISATDHSLMPDDCSAESLSEDGQGPPDNERPNLGLRAENTDLDWAKLTDDQLMAHLSLGYNDALAVLFDRYHRLVFSIARRIVRDDGEAEDVVQNVFLDIYRSIGQFEPSKGSTRVWIMQYAYHRALNRRRHLTAHKFYSCKSIEESESALPEPSSWDMGYTPAELRHLVQKGLSTLSSAEKRVIELASHDGLAMREIADKTGVSLANVRHHYYRGLRKLRSFVEQSGREEKVRPCQPISAEKLCGT
jgi:RNA polymerase sigma-70 factor, ECF subfamily